MPTGIALRDARAQLFAAAERVLVRDGPSGVTSRAVTDEAGVAKGVMHRHFSDFDEFLVELIRARIARLDNQAGEFDAIVGKGTLVANLAVVLTDIFTPTTLGLVALINSRDALRTHLRATTPRGIPIFTEASSMLVTYLAAERTLGRLIPSADLETLAFTLVGTGHLLFAGELGALPDASAVEEVVASIVVGVEPGARE
jgi:AcrR family transcriptional regulator